jgi:H+/Cl- antiporter ClcA
MGAGVVSILRLPLSSVVIALLLTSRAGLAVAPLIIAVAVAYITTEVLDERRASVAEPASPLSGPHEVTRIGTIGSHPRSRGGLNDRHDD